MDIYDMKTNSKVVTGELNHQSKLYTFFEFIEHVMHYCLRMQMKAVGYGIEDSGI
jgi:hypothetical protein